MNGAAYVVFNTKVQTRTVGMFVMLVQVFLFKQISPLSMDYSKCHIVLFYTELRCPYHYFEI